MISSSDVRWNAKNKMIMTNKLKSINNNAIANTSDSGEEVEKGSCFLKVGALQIFRALLYIILIEEA